MPVYIRSGELDIPAPTISSLDSDEESGVFLLDPDQVIDTLPQPYRMIDKVIDQLLEHSWDVVTGRAKAREEEAQKIKPPVYSPANTIEVFTGVTSMCHSGDIRYLFIGFESGDLVAFDAVSNAKIAEWRIKEYTACFDYIVCELIGPHVHLLLAIDDMGFARLVLFTNEMFLPVQLLNEQPEGSPKSNALKVDVSHHGEYLGVVLQCEGLSCLEIYKLPRDAWLHEIEVAFKDVVSKNNQASADSLNSAEADAPSIALDEIDVKFSSVLLVLKNRSQPLFTPVNFNNLLETVEKAGIANTVGNGSAHLVTEKHHKLRQVMSSRNHPDLPFINASPKNVTSFPSWHYLYTRVAQSESFPPSDCSLSVCIWWTDSHLLQIYSLQARAGKDMEAKPEIVWPMAGRITCTAVSECSNILAVGLENGLVVVVDRFLSMPKALFSVGQNIAVTFMHIMNESVTVPSCSSPYAVYILAQTEDCAVFLLDSNASACKPLLVVNKQHRQPVTVIPSFPRLFLTSACDQVQLYNTITGDRICDLAVSASFDSPQKRLKFSFGGDILYVRNDDSTVDEFRLQSIPLLCEYLEQRFEKEQLVVKETVEERCQRLLNDRTQKHARRNELLNTRWRVMSKELDAIMTLKHIAKSPRTASSIRSKWSKSADKIIAHLRSLK